LNGAASGNLGIMVYIAGSSYAAMTEDTGAYTISGVPVGASYVLVASSIVTQGYDSAISGKATLDGEASGNAGIFVFLQGTSHIAITDDAGAFSLPGVSTGSYELVANKEDYDSGSRASTTVAAGSTFVMVSKRVLFYAKWIPAYTVAYIANGATGGNLPSEAILYFTGDSITVLDNTGSLTLSGFNLAGWNTMADGSGTTYAPAATFLIGMNDVSLYAVWIPASLQFNATGNSIRIFSNSATLTGSLTIPGGVTDTGFGTFGSYVYPTQPDNGLISISIPASVISISTQVFD
jgi:hypothetical protein